jgi:hypothetical protein
MGGNSWDSFGTAVTEAEVKAQAKNYFVSGKLKVTDEQFARAPKYTTKSFLLFLLHRE